MSRFRRRLMGLAALRQAAADDFVRAEYIESTGTQWIDTGYKINNVDSFEIIIVTNGIQEYMGSNGNLQVDLSVSKNLGKRTIKVTHSANNGPNTYVNGSLVKSQNYHTYNGYIIALFAMGISSSAVGYYSSAAVYSAQLIINNTLVRDYIPVLNKTTDEYGMYDLVEQKFYTSPNGAKFVGGREIIYDAEIEYLESNGTQYINTEFIPNDSSGVYVRAYCKTSGGNHIVVGTRQSYGDTRWLINFSRGIEISWNTYIAYTYSYTNTWVEVENNFLNSRLGKIDGVTERTTYPTLASITYPVYIFTANIYGNPNTNTYTGRVSSVKISQGNEVVMDFIPVRVGNVGYMYDKVSGKLFGNEGSGNFILGKDVELYDKI